MKVKKIFSPQQNIADVIKKVRSSPPQEQNTILNAQLADIKKELRSSESRTLQIALTKLFYMKMEGVDLRQLDFLIVNCLSSTSFGPKRLACLQIPVSIDPNSQSLFMSTNLFKKELMKQNEIEVSAMLSCITNIVSADMAPLLIDEAIKLLKCSKPILRKKAMALVSKIFTIAPQTIQGNLEIILETIVLKEDNPTVLACFTSIVNCVLNTQPKLFPLFIKPLYELFLRKQRSNWFKIKMVKTFHKIIKMEPRLVKKMSELYAELLATTKSKALEYELLSSIVEYFHDETELYESACEKLKIFMEHDDPNLQSLGFNLLKKMVSTNRNIIFEYKGFLMDTFSGTNDTYTKFQTLEIFLEFMSKELFQEFSLAVLGQISNEKKPKKIDNLQFLKFQQKSIGCLLSCAQQNDYEFITDYSFLLNTVIYPLTKLPLTRQNALTIQNLIYDLVVRVEGLSQTIFNISRKVLEDPLRSRENCSIEEAPGAANPIPASEIIFQTFIFLVGEYSNFFKNGEQVLKVFESLDNQELLKSLPHSSSEIQTALLKCTVRLSNSKEADAKTALQLVNHRFISILENIRTAQGKQNFNIDIGSNLLLNIIAPKQSSSSNQSDSIHEVQESLSISEETIAKIATLDTIFTEFEPVHPEAWKYVKVPEDVDLSEVIVKNPEEIEKIAKKCKEFLTSSAAQNSSKNPLSSQATAAAVNGGNKNGESMEQNNGEAIQDNITQSSNVTNIQENNNEQINQDSEVENNKQLTDQNQLQEQEQAQQQQEQQKQQIQYTVKKFSVMPNGVEGKSRKNNNSDDEEDQ